MTKTSTVFIGRAIRKPISCLASGLMKESRSLRLLDHILSLHLAVLPPLPGAMFPISEPIPAATPERVALVVPKKAEFLQDGGEALWTSALQLRHTKNPNPNPKHSLAHPAPLALFKPCSRCCPLIPVFRRLPSVDLRALGKVSRRRRSKPSKN